MIIINRHNYEEYFLLYVDNELAAEDKLAVDRFIKDNSDLGEELDMLRQAVLPEEQVEFKHKEGLYNQEEGITSKNYETYFLLAVDRELSREQNEDVERFVLKHPELQSEFTLLQQTRLDPEPIEFIGKESLYRRKKERAVIVVKWVRMSAAAAVIGIVALSGFLLNQHTSTISKGRIVAIDKVKTTVPAEIKVTLPPVIKQQVAVLLKQQQNREEKILVKNESKKYVKINKETSIVKTSNTGVPAPVEKVIKKAETPDSRTRKQAFEEAIASAKISRAGNANVINETSPQTSKESKIDIEPNTLIAKPAVYHEINTSEDEDQTIYIGSAGINKNKLRGIFRKAAGLFEKKGEDNDQQHTLKIAGFEIKTK